MGWAATTGIYRAGCELETRVSGIDWRKQGNEAMVPLPATCVRRCQMFAPRCPCYSSLLVYTEVEIWMEYIKESSK